MTMIPPETPNEHLHRCWREQYCSSCLTQPSCSWCPFTQACVPNAHPISLLAPAYDQQICPHWSERWEIRTQPFGCQVSSITSLSVLVAVAATLVVVGLVWTVAVIWRRAKSRLWAESWTSRWRAWKSKWDDGVGVKWVLWRGEGGDGGGERVERVGEEEPLLGSVS
ncbi:hypothetical protein N657DRAFT_639867 [Parathielavia appendiculata]|uniref:PSI domain-containing protein n=1 Tax=Parathielavia appendiculata TaxID=2587402 RepID=A0AAN6UB56_9PEZI|nr:hypothetical protein N657DRAFT_639867 [Parathielavia appendiculata]